MNNKISSGQVLAMQVGLSVSLFPGLANILILNISKNASLLSIVLGSILGLIPLLMIISISKKLQNSSMREYLKTNYKLLGSIINMILILTALFILFINSWLTIDFIISQFLTRTSYYFIAILLFSTIIYTLSKGIETTSRAIFILFIITITIMFLLWISLIPYVEINNLKPFIDVQKSKIIKSSLIYITYTVLPIFYIIDLKHITKDKNKFERKIIISYIFSSIIIISFIFFILSVYGIDLASLFTYPVYSLFKKVQIIGFVERIENFAAIQIVVAFFIQSIYLLYYVINNITESLKLKSNNKYVIIITSALIPFISITFFKNNNFKEVITILPYILSILLIIIIILFITKKLVNNS